MEAFSTVYMDDIAGYNISWEDHPFHLQEVLKAFQQSHLTIKANKCQMGKGSVVYVGHMVGWSKVQTVQAKTKIILVSEPPKPHTEVKVFLALTGYEGGKVYGTIVAPLTKLISKKQPKKVIWTEDCQRAFDILKQAMCKAFVVKAPDFSQ
ncbi:uncharacterized protein [Pleurodeles waltl]|uniref:uncharacterized protein n=1 Tax=Pleurodeles waltl TaxID=8319 RepID=UPI0037098FDD